MPKGPRGEKRPADAIGLAVMIGKIATGEIEDTCDDHKSAAAQLGSKGGKKRAANMNFCRIHKTLRVSPAMAAGITDRLWSLEDVIARIDADAAPAKPRGPYKKWAV